MTLKQRSTGTARPSSWQSDARDTQVHVLGVAFTWRISILQRRRVVMGLLDTRSEPREGGA